MGNFKYTNSGMYNCYWLEQCSLSEQHPQWDPVIAYWNIGHAVCQCMVCSMHQC